MITNLKRRELARYRVSRVLGSCGVMAETLAERGRPDRVGAEAWLGEVSFFVQPGMVLAFTKDCQLVPVDP